MGIGWCEFISCTLPRKDAAGVGIHLHRLTLGLGACKRLEMVL